MFTHLVTRGKPSKVQQMEIANPDFGYFRVNIHPQLDTFAIVLVTVRPEAVDTYPLDFHDGRLDG